MKAHHVSAVLLFVCGLLFAATYIAGAKATAAEDRLKKAEEEARTYAGKFLDLQERFEGDIAEYTGSINTLQWRLEQCKEFKK